MLHDVDFSSKARVDRYGRKLAPDSGKRELQRFYRLDGDEGESESEEENEQAGVKLQDTGDQDVKQRRKRENEALQASMSEYEENLNNVKDEDEGEDDDYAVEKELQLANKNYDPARDGGFSTSSSDESGDDDDDNAELDEGDEEVEVRLPHENEVPMGQATSRLAVVNLDWDNVKSVDLLAVASSFVPSSGRILSVAIYPSEYGREQMEYEAMKGPPKDLFTTNTSNNKSRTFGANGHSNESSKEIVEKSENESAGSDSSMERNDGDENDDDDDDDQDEKIKNQLLAEDKDEEYSSTALRSYQLDRLRYYYAVITCSSIATAKALYESMDGREYLSSANFFDLRFIPEEVTFENDEVRDSCDAVPDGYRPAEFVTDALTRSKVKLTWDAEDRDRKEIQKRAFSRAEVDENDLMAYIGSASSSDNEGNDDDVIARPFTSKGQEYGSSEDAISKEDENKDPQTNGDNMSSRRNAKASTLRAALGLPTNVDRSPIKPTKERKEASKPVGDLQVTWTPAFSDPPKRDSVFANAPEETTRERYIRKERERKAQRKERMKEARSGVTKANEDANTADIAAVGVKALAADGGKRPKPNGVSKPTNTYAASTDPFDDPFFTDAAAAARAEKKARKAAREARRAAAAAAATSDSIANKAELELLMTEDRLKPNDNKNNNVDANKDTNTLVTHHFDMNEIARAEKKAARRKKTKRLLDNEHINDNDDDDDDDDEEPQKKRKRTASTRPKEAGVGVAAVDDFQMDVSDPRFAALYESHEYAIDPTNARFSGTKGMKALLEEGRRVRSKKMVWDGDDGGGGTGLNKGITKKKNEKEGRRKEKKKKKKKVVEMGVMMDRDEEQDEKSKRRKKRRGN